ncbi:MAG: THUMP domain-containing protein [Candidatus Caldarchaeum sp.]|nr:THUMP domain-containing protein [Candidatus Caldarchaeum sp.]MDW8435764.1 THUMP domain-containing protein [Candidatus Caldarchaeum sp.]
MRFFATTFAGLEDVAASELAELLAVDTEADVAKVFFSGDVEDCVKANFAGQTLNRVFLLLARDDVGSLDDVAEVAESVDYYGLVGRNQSFAVKAERVGVHGFTSLDVAAAVGRAVIESYKAATGVRLKVDLTNPDVEIYCILRNRELLIGLNTTGESLHRRWYRTGFHRAALSPTVANAMVRISGWKANMTLVDPFTGSGTIPLEAAVHGLRVSPGIRRRLALEKLVFIQPEDVERCRAFLAKRERIGEILNVMGFDVSPRSVALAESSLRASGLGDAVRFMVADVFRLDGVLTTHVDRVVCNPPFGLRMRLRQPEKFYVESFKAIRKACPDASLTVLVNKPTIASKALETAGYSVISARKILLGPITAHIITAV